MNHRDMTSRLRAMLEQVGAKNASEPVRSQLESRASGKKSGPELDVRRIDPESVYAKVGLEALDRLDKRGTIDGEQRFALEAIVMPMYRPVVDIVNDSIVADQLGDTWEELGDEARTEWIKDRVRAVGRINVPGIMYAGTAFIVGPNLLMTNRHVAVLFAQGLGTRVDFQAGQTASIGFYHEKGSPLVESLKVERVVMIHPWWDMAVLQVKGLPSNRNPLTLSTLDPVALKDRKVVVIGYPGYDPTGDAEFQRVQERIFRGMYYVKRFQPGLFRIPEAVESYGRSVDSVTHDCSTLGGNSGSAVIDLETGHIVGLHFAGEYLVANYAVSPFDLAQDPKLASVGVVFSDRVEPRGDFFGPIKAVWDGLTQEGAIKATAENGPKVAQPSNPAIASLQPGSTTWTIPLQVSVSLGAPVLTVPGVAIQANPTGPTQIGALAQEGQFSRSPPAALTAPFDLDALKSSTFTWKSALSLALASKLAYETRSAVERTARSDWGFESCEFIDVDDTQCFVALTSDIALVSFRGTESRGDWLRNVNVPGRTRDYGVVHRGFLAAFQTVESQLKDALSPLNGRDLLATGHSLGGALATVMAAEWQDAMSAARIATFGQPAVGGRRFRSFFLRNYSGRFFRFVNDDDLVPRVPPGYDHVGRLLHFDARGNLKSGQSLPLAESVVTESPIAEAFEQGPPMLTTDQYNALQIELARIDLQTAGAGPESLHVPVQEGLIPSVRDHSLDKYIAKIAALAGV